MTAGTGAPPAPMRPGRLIRSVRTVLVIAVLIFVIAAVGTRWSDVRSQLDLVSTTLVLLAFVQVLLGLLASMMAWRALLADLGSPLSLRPAMKVLFVAQLAKYAPGSTVWAVAAQTELSRAYGISRKQSAAAAFVLNLMVLGVGLLVALLAAPALLEESAPRWLHWLPLLALVGVSVLVPAVLTRLCNLLLRLARRPPLEQEFSGRGVVRAELWLVVMWVMFGLHVAVLGADLGSEGSRAEFGAAAVGAFAAAWCAGNLVIFLPTGAGTRELVLTLTLGAHMTGGATAALTVALVSRLLTTIADVLLAVCGSLLGRGTAEGANRARSRES